MVRSAWLYDFIDYPINIWQGQGKLFTSDDRVWLGSVDARGTDLHDTSSMTDGRDGSAATYTNTLRIPDMPGQPALQTYLALRDEQYRTAGQYVSCFKVIFKVGEGLRPQTPIAFFKELRMIRTKFSEKIELDSAGNLVKKYLISVQMKDGNFGRSDVPGGTYADNVQKSRAKILTGDPDFIDKGCEYFYKNSNRTYQIP